MQRPLLGKTNLSRTVPIFYREIWHCLCLRPFLCFHQSAFFLHESLPCSSRSTSFHGCQCICQCLDGFQFLEFHYFLCPCIWSSLDADLLFKENWSISQVDYSKAGRFQKPYEKHTPFWQTNCPLKREFHQSQTCLDLSCRSFVEDIHASFCPQHGCLWWKEIISLYHSFNVP